MASLPVRPALQLPLPDVQVPRQQTHLSHQETHLPDISPTQIKYEDEREKLNARLQVRWSEWMAGAQRNSSIYKRICVLLISWHPNCDDLKVQDEVAALRKVCDERYNFEVDTVHIDKGEKARPQNQVNGHLVDFVRKYDGENTLLIVYYAGHGSPGRYPGELRLTGKNNLDASDSHITWNHTEANLQDTYADILEILDCCYAGDIGRGSRTLRSWEYLAATSSYSTTPSPGPSSFTTALIWALNTFADEGIQRFTMTELANKIRSEAPGFPRDQVPTLTSRDPESTQRIVLSALPRKGEAEPAVAEPIRAMTECLDLKFYFDRTPNDNELKGIATVLAKHICTPNSSLYRVSFGKLDLIARSVVKRWRSHSRSNSATATTTATIIDNRSAPRLTSQQTISSVLYQETTTEINRVSENQEEPQGMWYHAKMLLYSVWLAITPVSDRRGTLVLV